MNISLRLGQIYKITQMFAILDSVCNIYISGTTKSFRQEPTPTCFIFSISDFLSKLVSRMAAQAGKRGKEVHR